jgi:hypothetical protein
MNAPDNANQPGEKARLLAADRWVEMSAPQVSAARGKERCAIRVTSSRCLGGQAAADGRTMVMLAAPHDCSEVRRHLPRSPNSVSWHAGNVNRNLAVPDFAVARMRSVPYIWIL